MEIYGQEKRATRKARERQNARQRKQMVVRRDPHDADPAVTQPVERPVMSRAPREADKFDLEVLKGHALVLARDAAWFLRQNPLIVVGLALLPVLVFGLYVGAFVIGDRVFPNVWVLGRDLGGLSADDAAGELARQWAETRIELTDGSRAWTVSPGELGMTLDAAATVAAAKNVGLAGVPFGYDVAPSFSLDFLAAQNTLLDLTEATKILPYNASFRWAGEQLTGVTGTDGRFLDIAATLSALESNLVLTARSEALALAMTTMPPDTRDPAPYVAQAQAFVSKPFVIRGYDPFNDEHFAWTTDRNTLTSWLEVGTDGLTLRQDVYADFVAAQTVSLQSVEGTRYVEPIDSIDKMQEAIRVNSDDITVRVRRRAFQYAVEPGDSGYRIARKNGVPFYQLELANPNRDWNVNLSVDELVNIPSLDIMLPVDPVPNKRIVVNLRTQTLAIFENGAMIRTWVISSGMDRAPTSPGIFQILSHDEKASGGSFEMCSDMGCAQWEMDWFMGIYEVVPGLVNGFHGNVLLANGSLLGDGNVGYPATYGCVMSENEPALWLYEWAQVGTMVEIVAGDYLPRSAVAAQIWNDGARTFVGEAGAF